MAEKLWQQIAYIIILEHMFVFVGVSVPADYRSERELNLMRFLVAHRFCRRFGAANTDTNTK